MLHSEDRYLSGIAPYLAVDRHIEMNSSLYYTVLHQCSGGKFHADAMKYHFDPLAWFFCKILESSLADIGFYRQRYEALQKLSTSAIAILDCFKSRPEKRLKVADIVKETQLPRRTVQYGLRTLAKQNFLQLLGKGAGSRYQLVF